MFIFFSFSICIAKPFLACSPQDNVDLYKFSLNGTDYEVQYERVGNDVILLDLAGKVVTGNNVVRNLRSCNMWGESTPVTFPFDTTIPSAPSGVRLLK
jgi:glycine/serine hydroxymethyltransferase